MSIKNNPVIFKNAMEQIVESILQEILPKYDICTCEICLCDIIAFTLNQLPPKYVVHEKGDVYTRLSLLEIQYRADVVSAVSKAIEMVKNNPRH